MPEENSQQNDAISAQPATSSDTKRMLELTGEAPATSQAPTPSSEMVKVSSELVVKKSELARLEKEIEDRTVELRVVTAELSRHGKSYAGAAIAPQETDEQRITREAKALLAGTGLEDRIG